MVYYLSNLKNKRNFFIVFIYIMQCIVFTTFIIFMIIYPSNTTIILLNGIYLYVGTYTSTYFQYNTGQELFYVFFCNKSIDISAE